MDVAPRFLGDHEHAQLFIGAEAEVGPGRDERRATFTKLELLSVDVKRAGALEDDVDRIVRVRPLLVRLRRYKHIDADLEPRRFVDNLVAAVGGTKVRSCAVDVEGVSWSRCLLLEFVG